MKNRNNIFLSVGFLIVLTMVMTYPLILNMGSTVSDPGDPLCLTWAISWNIKVLTHLGFQHYFDANIFFPHKRTLAYSDHLFIQSLIATPAFLVSKNPIFAFNFTLIFSFLTSALGMFFLARYLTNNSLAGIVAGVVFAFSPFMISHMGHLQVVSAGGIPLAFLFLHKFVKQERFRDLLLFEFFFIIQILSNGYYAMYLALFAGLYMAVFIFCKNKVKDGHFWIKMVVFLFILVVVVGPFLRQYVMVVNEMGFLREKVKGARFSDFLSTMPGNWIYGQLTRIFFRIEGQLFPGISAILLAVLGMMYGLKKPKIKPPPEPKYVLIYSVILLFSFLFTFGLKGPYWVLYKFIPGFNALRVANRFHIMVMFSLAVLAAFGIKRILFSKKKRKYLLFSVLLILILGEYWSVPIQRIKVPNGKDIPEVYQTLAELEEDASIIELPISFAQPKYDFIEARRVYYSIFHWKKLVNGRSSFYPPLYIELSRRWRRYHDRQFVNDLKSLGVDYMIVHSHLINKKKMNVILSRFATYKKDLQLIKKVGGSYVYKILFSEDKAIKKEQDYGKSIPKCGWRVMSNANMNKAKLACDGNFITAWQSGPQRRGYYFQIDLSRVRFIRGIRLRLASKQPFSHPDRFKVLASVNGVDWAKIAEGNGIIVPITEYLTPKKVSFLVSFKIRRARYIKIVSLRNHKKKEWTISEIDVFE